MLNFKIRGAGRWWVTYHVSPQKPLWKICGLRLISASILPVQAGLSVADFFLPAQEWLSNVGISYQLLLGLNLLHPAGLHAIDEVNHAEVTSTVVIVLVWR